MDLPKTKHHMINNRNLSIDFIKGILIYLVVLGHILRGQYMNGLTTDMEESLRFIIYLFHMPLFFFFSGYLIKSDKIIPQYIFDKIKYIGIIFIISSFIYMIIFQKISIISIVFLITSPYNHLWFLEVLVMYFFLLYFLRLKNIGHKKVIIVSIILAIFATGFRDLGTTVFNQFGYKPIFRGVEYFLYFYLGYVLKNNLIHFQFFQTHIKKIWLIVFISILLTIINYQIHFLKMNFYLFYSFGFVFLNLSLGFIIVRYLNIQINNKLLIDGGQASLFIYLWHYGLITVAFNEINRLGISNIFINIFLSIFIFSALIFVNKFLSKYDYFKYLGAR